jgi:hypothetical protein
VLRKVVFAVVIAAPAVTEAAPRIKFGPPRGVDPPVDIVEKKAESEVNTASINN